MCLVAGIGLAGCMQGGDGDQVSRFRTQSPEAAERQAAREAVARQKEAEASVIIRSLQARSSALSSKSSYGQVADAVLAASSRAAEAELRAARLRATAASKNWLPRIGPNISLTSLGDFVASLIVEQVLFDNGRKKAEREFAKADVEVAAVVLSDDTNGRVAEALDLYVTAEEGRETAALSAQTLKEMAHFEWVMEQRVAGGVSDLSDLNVLRHKLAQIRADGARGQEMKTAALAELNAMSAKPLSGVRGLTRVRVPADGNQSLALLQAEAEAARKIAQARIDRAGQLPGLTASGQVGSDGSSGALRIAGDSLIGAGTGATLKAIALAEDAAKRQVAEAREDAERTMRNLDATLAAKRRQAAEADELARQAKVTLDLFQTQFEAGTRKVMDVVGVYETYAQAEQKRITLKFEAARVEIDIARELGRLADGSAI
ncbi:transporter [Pseudaestuariivita atlantica]|uniref:Transporter n=1 Tax=Pseudaestuariivita atlantica TaxID=1317121 RepID=A0A0L1JQZ4_9RHOB|nr:transporter [Pseudaestuariivita atlantica]